MIVSLIEFWFLHYESRDCILLNYLREAIIAELQIVTWGPIKFWDDNAYGVSIAYENPLCSFLAICIVVQSLAKNL